MCAYRDCDPTHAGICQGTGNDCLDQNIENDYTGLYYSVDSYKYNDTRYFNCDFSIRAPFRFIIGSR